MRIVWSLPVRGETLASTRGDLVRARALITALRDQGHEVTVVEDGASRAAMARVRAYRRILRRMLPERAAVALRDAGRILHSRSHARRVAESARRHDADVIIETQVHFNESGALASRLAGVPLVLDDASPLTEEQAFGAALAGLARRAFHRQVDAATAVCVPSRVQRDLLAGDGVPAHKLRVVPNGVDAVMPERAAKRSPGPRCRPDRIVAGFVGSFQPWHRTDLLIEAVHALADPRLEVHLVGEGPGMAFSLKLARRLGLAGRVVVHGPLDRTSLAVALGDWEIGVLPGTMDYGHPMKLLDYAAASLAIVAPDVAAVLEVIDDGETGLVFRAGDAEDLASVIGRLAADAPLRDRLGRKARTEIAERSSWHDRARELLAAATSVERPAGQAA